MNVLPHPLSFLRKEWVEIIRQAAPAAEAAGQLTAAQLSLLYGQKWFQLLAPQVYGGLQWSLPEALQLEEAVSCADGSMGWVLTLCAGAGWFGGFLESHLAEIIFANPEACLAGSGGITGIAEITDDGYLVNGKWMHASGAPNATIFTANCEVAENGQLLKDNYGKPIVRAFILLPREVSILPTWNSIGMVATASHAFQVKNRVVPKERAFEIKSSQARIDAPLYHYPFLQLAETTLAINLSGICMHFIDLCEDTFNHKKKSVGAIARINEMTNALQNAKEQMQTARNDFYAAVATSWQQCEAANKVDEAILSQVSTVSHQLAQVALHCTDTLYPYCGLYAADKGTEINRVWRDIHTASQHALLAFKPL